MPTAGENITNVACLIIDEAHQVCAEAKTDNQSPDLRIKKMFIDGTTGKKKFQVGDLVGYRIEFGNKGNAEAALVTLKDLLPQNLEFISSKIYF
jgi:uncharacterized repeat protein (TIGR01451 family)